MEAGLDPCVPKHPLLANLATGLVGPSFRGARCRRTRVTAKQGGCAVPCIALTGGKTPASYDCRSFPGFRHKRASVLAADLQAMGAKRAAGAELDVGSGGWKQLSVVGRIRCPLRR